MLQVNNCTGKKIKLTQNEKILHVIVGLNRGGAERMLERLLLSESEGHINRVVISLTTLGEIGANLRLCGYTVYALNARGIRTLPSTLFSLLKIIRCYNPDIVQTWLYHADLVGGIAAMLAGVKHIIWGIRTTEVDKRQYRTIIIRRICAVLSYIIPSKIICVADASRKKHQSLGYSSKKMIVIPNGFDLSALISSKEDRDNFRLRHGIDASDIVIGSLGRFDSMKAQDIFVRSVVQLLDEFPKLRFLMIGKNLDVTNNVLMTWIKATNFAERFILLGERSDIPIGLSAMDIFCLHSRSEGLPNVLGEAMAMQLPCVATDVGDVRVLLADTGIIVEKNSINALVAGLRQLLRLDNIERKKMGMLAAERIKKEFTLENACTKFALLYDDILNGKK